MLRYFFDVHDGIDVIDHEGIDLPDDDAAREYGRRVAVEFASRPRMFRGDGSAVVVSVRDEAGARVMTARFVLSVEDGHGSHRYAVTAEKPQLDELGLGSVRP